MVFPGQMRKRESLVWITKQKQSCMHRFNEYKKTPFLLYRYMYGYMYCTGTFEGFSRFRVRHHKSMVGVDTFTVRVMYCVVQTQTVHGIV